ncbi:hypothetical protein HRTV-25_gp103 [Halorubrum tailed virus 25]|uniref:Uncharacterized protein n=1 Tax=Halorubrum tailed virus 25 TaxID=2878006 RepID=A0AAE8XZX9_9CAUD|nr:hypothetical protein M1M37_gp103 [Halorubrum tailed virus 25]UBF22684.1 hypothetical protein HRTV-25_gp103 [Halorubrum tailed virus 25]
MNHTDNLDALRKDALESVGQIQTEIETILAESDGDSEHLDRMYFELDEIQAALIDSRTVEAARELESE